MPHSTYFVQGCPTCGRRLHVRVEYLGKKVICQHCRGPLVACDGAGKGCGEGQADGASLLHRANEILKRAADRIQRSRQSRPK
jgi:hypothetical protein